MRSCTPISLPILVFSVVVAGCQTYVDRLGTGDGERSDVDADGDGWSPDEGDCDDADPDTYPGAEELCDGIDNDCDGSPGDDEIDADGDGYLACAECDDGDEAIFPGADELCNGTDDDCDGLTDEDDATDASTWYEDADGDGFGDATSTTAACEMPDGYADDATDCDDTRPDVHPGADEDHADGVDQDCDGLTDEYHVCWDGTGEYELVSEAVLDVPEGAIVEVCPGTYDDSVELQERSVSIIGATGDPEDVVIDASGDEYAFYQASTSAEIDFLFQGITVVGGYANGYRVLNSGGSTIISDYVIRDTTLSEFRGALIEIGSRSGEIKRGIVRNNEFARDVTYIMRIWEPELGVLVEHNIIEDNGFVVEPCDIVISDLYENTGTLVRNNIISNNNVKDRIIYLYVSGNTDQILNNTIVDNIVSGAIIDYVDDSAVLYGYLFSMRNNLFCGNNSESIVQQVGSCEDWWGCASPFIEYNWICEEGTSLFDLSFQMDLSDTNTTGVPVELAKNDSPPYSLPEGCPAVDTGDPSTEYNDVDGTRNDPGAYGGPGGNWSY